jgi:hypothetical protein
LIQVLTGPQREPGGTTLMSVDTILTYTAEPGSKSEEALNLLGSWAATLDQAEPANVTDR